MKFTKKNDLYLLIVVILLVLVMIFMNTSPNQGIIGAEVHLKGDQILQITKEGTYSVISDEGELLMNVEYVDQRIRVTDSSCPLKVCENTGWVENPNQPIICIPNEITVKPLGTQNGEGIDIYTW
ncbi:MULTISPECIES: NusG domain II-containing protein [Petrotoga]|uniref:Uncharacterized protein n=3 Tax=Thermotogae TaxID=188708 RepID=A0A4R8EUT7_9BACT|nr:MULTISPECIES: NusG domain II-containing protein [Petrotoga]KUK80628.1 MAG: Uncharacterized protein XD94_0859 [Mesotoga prima]POZ88175.1 hypothetical protein AA80_07300 [Petrotoga sibirica DSM 13575]POZ90290.1 hypothetical protein AD60_07275 [Petrotoga sp. SL27]TDX16352.1 hypothetical protein C8D74_10327 [Petrotoga sibirica]